MIPQNIFIYGQCENLKNPFHQTISQFQPLQDEMLEFQGEY